MIISNPTGLYTPILPKSGEVGNITYTISTQDPPRSQEIFVQLPLSEEIRKSPDRIFTKIQKRRFYGQLLYDITIPGPSDEGSGNKQFEIGEVLEFTDQDLEADFYELSRIELRQDLKVVDFSIAGLTEEEYNELVLGSEKKINELSDEINKIGQNIKVNSSNISENQSAINNSNNILENIIVVLGLNHPSAGKVKQNIENLQEERNKLLKEREGLQFILDDLRSQLQRVRESVR